MAKTGVVKKPFPYSADGINIRQLKQGEVLAFPQDFFDGLQEAGYIDETDEDAASSMAAAAGREDITDGLNERFVAAFDRRLMDSSDEELKDIIARSGKPWSGNLVHAEMVAAAKAQLVREAEGVEPILDIDPNAGVTEQPLSAHGAPTPPSAAEAVEQQQEQQKAAGETTADPGAGENKATNQFGDPLPARGKPSAPGDNLDEMTVAELKERAEKSNIDLGDATKKADIIAAIKAAK